MRILLKGVWLSVCFCFLPDAHAETSKYIPQYKVGFIVSLTGALGEFGEAIRNGVILAQEEVKVEQRRFLPIFEDSKYDSKTAILNYEKLRSQDKVDALYVFGGPMSDTLAPISEKHRLPMFSTEYDTRYTKDRKYVVRFANNAEDYASALLKVLREKGSSKFGIIRVENQYHNTLSDAFIRSLKEGEIAEVVKTFLPGERDFRSIFPKLKRESYDALGVYLSPGMQNAFFKQFQSQQMQVSLFGTDTFESREENRGVESVVEGSLYANSAVSEEFVQRYEKRFHVSAQLVHTALAYEFTRLLMDSLPERQIRIEPEELIERVQFSNTRRSVCGEFAFRNTPETGKYFSFPIAVREVQKGAPRVKMVIPAP